MNKEIDTTFLEKYILALEEVLQLLQKNFYKNQCDKKTTRKKFMILRQEDKKELIKIAKKFLQKSTELKDFELAVAESNIPILVQIFDWARIPESFHKNILNNYEILKPTQ